jgi:hypothetical protein
MRRLGIIAFIIAQSVAAATDDPQQLGGIRCQVCADPSCSVPPAGEGQSTNGPRGGATCGEDGDTIDVLFLYTANARIEAGGLAGVDAAAQFAINDINTTLAASAVPNLQFRRVGFREIAYDEFAGNPTDGLAHLQRLSGVGDGYMEEAHAWRDQDRADLVALIVATGNNYFGGVAWGGVYDPASGFAVCDLLSTEQATFTHEWGHNLGLFHQCTTFAGDNLRYARGYLWNNSQTGAPWATAMVGYSDVCPRPNNLTYIPRYSNPDLFYQGERTGIPLTQPGATHEALAIRETHFAVANYRQSLDTADCNGNGISDSQDISSGTSADTNLNGRPDECETRLYVNISTPTDGDGSSWAVARRDLAEALRVAALPCSNVREIWVAAGTYKPDAGTNRRDLSFALGASARVYGGFVGGETLLSQRNPATHVTTLSGDIGTAGNASDNTYSIVSGYSVGPGALLDGFTITGGNSAGDGGGLYFDNSSPTVRNCIITGCHADGYGGAVACVYGGAAQFEDCTFSNNTSNNGGGGTETYLTNGVTFTRCTYSNNTAAWAAGAWMHTSNGAQYTDCDFLNNISTTYTGAVEQYASTSVFDSCVWQDNTAATYGGAITINAGGATITDSQLASNDAADWGGAIAVFGGAAVTVAGCEIRDNIGTDLGGGAVVAGVGTQGTFRQCTIDGNSSAMGGGISAYDQARVTLDQCVLIDNSSSGNGGGIDASFAPIVYISRTHFLGNHSALDGGGIFTNNATLTVVNSAFSGNRAIGGGGGGIGLYLGSSHTIANTSFAGNNSNATGGAVYAWQAPFTMSNSLGWFDSPGEIGLFSGATATVTYSNLQGGFAGSGNLNVNPSFVNRLGADGLVGTLDDNLQVQASSPCIDAGNSNLVPADALDLDGDSNLIERTPFDLAGATRTFDDPARPNTGVGTPPVDMGAYESNPPACPGDLNGDNVVSLSDLATLLSNFGRSGASYSDGDLNQDGNVDLNDLALMLSRFGATCP